MRAFALEGDYGGCEAVNRYIHGESHTNRSNHTFYSYNPLAKASKKCGYGMSWLDFSRIPNDSPLKQIVTGYIWMGSVGEGYSPLMAIMPMAYRVWDSPTELYDGMIFVSKAQPIVVGKALEAMNW